MPIVAHLGVGFAAKSIAKDVPVGYLVLAAEAIDIVYIGLLASGIESVPTELVAGYSPFSHSLATGLAISLLGALATWLISKNKKKTLIIGLLIFSHTLLDIIAAPQLAFYPTDMGMPLYPLSNIRVGLGIGRNMISALILEIGFLLGGLAMYIQTKRKMGKTK